MSRKKIKGNLEDENTYTCVRKVTETPDWGYIRSKQSLFLFLSITLVKILRSTYLFYWSKTLYIIIFQVSLCTLVNKSSNFSTGSGGSGMLI